jgi:hypothetical protein
MKKVLLIGSLGVIALTLYSCSGGNNSANMTDDSSSVDLPVPDVSYEGVLDEAGVSIYQEGTHRLTLADDRFILLESSTIDLDSFIGSRVMVTGKMRDTVEAGGRVMAVSEVALVESSEESSSSASSEAMSVASSSEAASSIAPTPSSVAAPPPPPPPAAVSSSSAASVAAPPPPPPPASGIERDPALQARINKMAAPKPESSWTQQYCSSHNGIRFPVRSDWWYHSFGATTSNLWHVELNSEEIKNLGDGPVVVNLISGRLPEGQSDGSVVEANGTLTVYRSWTDNRHIQVSGPVELRTGMEYLAKNISTCDTAQ